MNTTKAISQHQKLHEWVNGNVADDQLTDEDIETLQLIVINAITNRLYHERGHLVFDAHDTVQ
jgi:hypothetical protein